MIRLVAKKNNVQTQLDVLGNENINITYAIDDISVSDTKDASYSKDFVLPGTKVNNRFFEHFYNVDITNLSFDISSAVDAYLEKDGTVLIEGYLQLISVEKKRGEHYYKVVIYDQTATLFSNLGDDTFMQLNLSETLHTKYKFNFDENTGTTVVGTDYDNVENSWTSTGVTTDNFAPAPGLPTITGSTDDIFYPLVYNDDIYETSANTASYNASLTKNYPISINLKYVLDKIFERAGYQVQSDFFATSEMNDIFMTVPGSYAFANGSTLSHVEANTIASAPVSISNSTPTTLVFSNETADEDSEYNLSTGVFTAHTDMTINAVYQYNIQVPGSYGSATQLQLIATVNDTAVGFSGDVVLVQSWTGGNGNASPVVWSGTLSGNLFLSQGATATFKILSLGTDTLDIVNAAGNNGGNASPYNRLTINRYLAATPSRLVQLALEDVKLVDVLRDVFKVFNLVSEPVNSTTLKIEPYSNFVGTGATLDWSNKVDIQKAKITPLKGLKECFFKYATDEDDFYLKQYEEITGTEYGSHYQLINENETGSMNVELSVFAPGYFEYTSNMNYPIGYALHIGKEENGGINPYLNKPRLIYKNGNINNLLGTMQFIDASQYIYNVGTEVLEHDQYSSGYMWNNDIINSQNSDLSLGFGLITTDTNITQPVNTLFTRFYLQYINERIDTADSFLYTIEINLTASDVFNFSFADLVKIKGQQYRVNKIQYNTSKTKLARVELFRI